MSGNLKERWTEGFWGWGVWNWRNAKTAQVFLVLINGWKRDFIKKKARSFLVSPTLKYGNTKFLKFSLTSLIIYYSIAAMVQILRWDAGVSSVWRCNDCWNSIPL